MHKSKSAVPFSETTLLRKSHKGLGCAWLRGDPLHADTPQRLSCSTTRLHVTSLNLYPQIVNRLFHERTFTRMDRIRSPSRCEEKQEPVFPLLACMETRGRPRRWILCLRTFRKNVRWLCTRSIS